MARKKRSIRPSVEEPIRGGQGPAADTDVSTLRISPRARRAARILNVAWEDVLPARPSGRICERDVCLAAARRERKQVESPDTAGWREAIPAADWGKGAPSENTQRFLEFPLNLTPWRSWATRWATRCYPHQPARPASVAILSAAASVLHDLPQMQVSCVDHVWRHPDSPRIAWRVDGWAGDRLPVLDAPSAAKKRRLRRWCERQYANIRQGRPLDALASAGFVVDDFTESPVTRAWPRPTVGLAAALAIGRFGGYRAGTGPRRAAAVLVYDEQRIPAPLALRFCTAIQEFFERL